MAEQKVNDDTDQQKKVTFDEKDDRAPSSKENKDQGHDEHEDEGSYTLESDDQKLQRIAMATKSLDNEGNLENNDKDMKDGLGDDLEILEKNISNEERKSVANNEGDVIKADAGRTNENENSRNNETVKPETEFKSDSDKNGEGVGSSGSMGYSLNSRRSTNERKESTEKTEKALNSGPETSAENETVEKKITESDSAETQNESQGKENTGGHRLMKWEEDKNKDKQEVSKNNEPVVEKHDDTVKQSSKNDEIKTESNENERNDPQYQTDDEQVGTGSHTKPTKEEKETKAAVKKETYTKPKSEQSFKQRQQSNTKPSVETSQSRAQVAGANKTSTVHAPRQSYPRAARTETSSPSVNIERQRNERRQLSQSARYPSQSKSSSRDTTVATRSSSRASTVRSYRPPSRPRTCLGFPSEGRRRDREFFHAELQRLKDSLRKESKKIKKPKVRDNYPDVFNSLAPYYDTYTANYLIKMPDLGYKESQPPEAKKTETESEDTKDLMYTTRCTAIGLCDPWDSLNMDRSVLPKLETAEIRRKRIEQMHAAETKPKSGRASSSTDRSGKTTSPSSNTETDQTSPRQKRPEAKQGSTRLPKFPVIAPPNSDLTTKELHYGDVPMLRDEMIKSFSHYGDERRKSDYNRTRQDFFRMELDRLNEYHHTTRPHMRAAYFAYLQNTPGSRKAIYDCMKEVTSPKKKEEPAPQAVA